jgi:predicted outer membrane repeat protein
MIEKEISRELLNANPLLWIKERDEISFKDNTTKQWEEGGAIQSIFKEETGEWYVNVKIDGDKTRRVNLDDVYSVKIFKG